MEPTSSADHLGRDIVLTYTPEERPRGALAVGIVGLIPVALLAVALLSGVLGG